ncbi:hypothetical protein ACB087_04470 [Vibrio sp. VNB-15]
MLTQAEVNGFEQHFPVPVQDFKFSVFQEPKEQQVEMTSAEILMPIDVLSSSALEPNEYSPSLLP